MIDDLDRAILRLVQRDNQRTHAEIGDQVGLSASSVRRRLSRLREVGLIEADVSIVSPEAAGVEAVVLVTFGTESVEHDAAFRERMQAEPAVTQCYSVSGDVDYVLVVHAPDLPTYEAWGKRVLMSDATISRYSTHLVWKRVKFSTELPL
ncbi:MAG: Lrp/AsnC family transcriptional regulator [Bacteroidota bacterium]